jgi:hypothetical protein
MPAPSVSNLIKAHGVSSLAADTYSVGVVWRIFGSYAFRKGTWTGWVVQILNAWVLERRRRRRK